MLSLYFLAIESNQTLKPAQYRVWPPSLRQLWDEQDTTSGSAWGGWAPTQGRRWELSCLYVPMRSDSHKDPTNKHTRRPWKPHSRWYQLSLQDWNVLPQIRSTQVTTEGCSAHSSAERHNIILERGELHEAHGSALSPSASHHRVACFRSSKPGSQSSHKVGAQASNVTGSKKPSPSTRERKISDYIGTYTWVWLKHTGIFFLNQI